MVRDTTLTAYASIRPKAGTMRAKLLEFIRGRGGRGATSDEASVALGFAFESTRPRATELAKVGLIEDGGERRTSKNGGKAIVWVAA